MMEKWPKNWIEHVFTTCSFYFEDKSILFVDSKIFCYDLPSKGKDHGIRLTFQKYDKLYDIFINYENSYFVVDYYYKNYYRLRKKKDHEQDFISFIDTWMKGSDILGLFSYFDLGGESSKDIISSPYEIIQSIEKIINCHSNKGDNGFDNDGENNPIEPFSPSNEFEPELTYT